MRGLSKKYRQISALGGTFLACSPQMVQFRSNFPDQAADGVAVERDQA
jgi:hypothetical protein